MKANDDLSLAKKLNEESIEFEQIEVKNFDGLSEMSQIVIGVSAIVIPVVGKIIIELIKAKKDRFLKNEVFLKFNNFEFKGNMTEETVREFFQKILKIEKKNNGDT